MCQVISNLFSSFFGFKLYQLSPSDEKRDNEVIIQECVQNFASRDFIMEPDIFNNIRRYQLVSNKLLFVGSLGCFCCYFTLKTI